jgi:hypothetical protein
MRASRTATTMAMRFRLHPARNPRFFVFRMCPNLVPSFSLHTLTLNALPLGVGSSLLSRGVLSFPPRTDTTPSFLDSLGARWAGWTCRCSGSLQYVLVVVTLILAAGALERRA